MNPKAIERAQMVSTIDDLKDFKKAMQLRNMELIKFEAQTAKDIANVIDGCMRMIETDTLISDRVDHVSDRIDIVNKRLRKLEKAMDQVQRLLQEVDTRLRILK
jgi:LPS O-antigen subunit length determinant protein (WzzB/FepE family)